MGLDFESSLCDQIPASVAEQALNTGVLSTEATSDGITSVCKYLLAEEQYVILRLNNLDYESQKTGQEALDRTITTDDRIAMDHFVAVQENGLINDIVLKLADDLFISVDRSSGTAINEEQIMAFAGSVAAYLHGDGSAGAITSDAPSTPVPEPQEEDVLRGFFQAIDEDRASDAVLAMSSRNLSDDSTKQAWGAQFDAMSSVTVLGIEPSLPDDWTKERHTYQVDLNVAMDPASADAPIPYFGYADGQNTRWVTLVSENGLWRVDEIATGP